MDILPKSSIFFFFFSKAFFSKSTIFFFLVHFLILLQNKNQNFSKYYQNTEKSTEGKLVVHLVSTTKYASSVGFIWAVPLLFRGGKVVALLLIATLLSFIKFSSI